MASTNQMKATFISKKLKFLKARGSNLISEVEQYVSRIIAAGESWAERGGDKLEYLELCHMIDAAVEFLCEKCEELTGRSLDVAANQLSWSSCEQPNLATQVITGTASSSAASYRQTTVSVQPADETHLKPVLARIAVIEEVMYSFRNNAEKVAEQQIGIDQQLKELLSKLSESDKKQNSRFAKVKEQIIEISETQDAMDQEHKTSLQNLERQVQKLCTAQDRLEDGMKSQEELVEKCDHLSNQLEAVKDNINALHSRIDGIIDDCSNKHEDIKTVTYNLADKVMANTQTVQVISEGQEQTASLLREMETRLQTLEVDSGRNIKRFQMQAEKGEANLRILCQMLNDRLTPVEQLRTSLNERASMRDDNIKKLSQVIQEVAVMSPRLQQLELKLSRTGCGFSALKTLSEDDTGKKKTQFKIRYSTVGNNFDADSGIFTAPFDGLYVAAVSIYLCENIVQHAYVQHQDNLSKKSTTVCECSAAVKGTNACCVCVVDLKVGDTLLTYVYNTPTSGNFNEVYFTCFLLRNQHLRTPNKPTVAPFPSANVASPSTSSALSTGAVDHASPQTAMHT